DILDKIPNTPLYEDDAFESHVLYKFKKEKPFTITRDGNEWTIRGDDIERLFRMTKFSSTDATIRFAKKLKNYGVDDELKKMGAQDGDIVKILDFEFEYRE
ncbi:MAG: Obg family GTPase CgtA, partial [Bacilli bacterium]|nr:Obg family GTPase CgtA [Bacilli bacterium]